MRPRAHTHIPSKYGRRIPLLSTLLPNLTSVYYYYYHYYMIACVYVVYASMTYTKVVCCCACFQHLRLL